MKSLSVYYEIAYAAASKRLCLFTGTGFSKAITNNAAPSWQELLEKLCDLTSDPASLKNALFPPGLPRVLGLEEAAQVIDLELRKVDKMIHNEIAAIISRLTVSGDNSVISQFLQNNHLEVVTTNYDKLLERLVGEQCHSLAPGVPVPRSDSQVKVHHVHGSVDSPLHMVVTSEDYFKFLHAESYFSRKLSTVLHENTVVILGYSLGDTNLKSILNEYRGFARSHAIASNLFLVSRSAVSQHVKDYYFHCYGVRVLDNTDVHGFFRSLNSLMPVVTPVISTSLANLQVILGQQGVYTPEYLRSSNSFYQIICSFSALGLPINHAAVVRSIGSLIQTKHNLTLENGAWDQYTQMANWLIYLGSILEIEGTAIQEIFLAAVHRSMSTMTSAQVYGYSWHAFAAWRDNWKTITYSNRLMIKRYVTQNFLLGDPLLVVNQ